jgi:PAS domain S-box-containing protein
VSAKVDRPEQISTLHEVASLRTSLDQSDRLLHELRVHQVELEIQNRALREAQEQLEMSRERYVELFDFAPVAYLSLESDGRVVEANLTAAELLGHDREVMIGRRLQTLVGLSDPVAFRSLIRSALTQSIETRSELTFRTVQQEAVTVDVVILPILESSKQLGRVRVAFHDVTARAAAEHHLRFLNQAGARLARIPLGSPGLLAEIAAAGAFGSVDGCWIEFDGQETSAWRSEPLRRKMNSEALEVLRLQIASSVREARSLPASASASASAIGRWSDVLGVRPMWAVVRTWISVPLFVQSEVRGTLTLFLSYQTESESVARTLVEEFARRVMTLLENSILFHRAEEAARSRDEMMAVLAHDLSNALFSIRLHAQRGLAKGGEQAQRALASVARGSQWLLGLVKTVLDVAGTEGGHIKLHRQQGNLAKVLESACLLQQIDADERKLQIVRDWPEDLSFDFDQERLLQVFFNLVNNAVKFTPAGGKVQVGGAHENGQVRVWVHDSGNGLARDQLERVFERGWQAEPKAGGKGLGLYISRRIVEAHGGTMWVESTTGRGATFFVAVPTQKVAEPSRHDTARVEA